MCWFCDYIFDYQLLFAKTRKGSKHNQMQEKERSIFVKKGSPEIYLATGVEAKGIAAVAETGDPFCKGWLDDIKYCPYCGRKLVDEDV